MKSNFLDWVILIRFYVRSCSKAFVNHEISWNFFRLLFFKSKPSKFHLNRLQNYRRREQMAKLFSDRYTISRYIRDMHKRLYPKVRQICPILIWVHSAAVPRSLTSPPLSAGRHEHVWCCIVSKARSRDRE